MPAIVTVAVLIVMMRLRPEGLWPSDIRQRELHASDETLELDAGADAIPGSSCRMTSRSSATN